MFTIKTAPVPQPLLGLYFLRYSTTADFHWTQYLFVRNTQHVRVIADVICITNLQLKSPLFTLSPRCIILNESWRLKLRYGVFENHRGRGLFTKLRVRCSEYSRVSRVRDVSVVKLIKQRSCLTDFERNFLRSLTTAPSAYIQLLLTYKQRKSINDFQISNSCLLSCFALGVNGNQSPCHGFIELSWSKYEPRTMTMFCLHVQYYYLKWVGENIIKFWRCPMVYLSRTNTIQIFRFASST